MPIKIGLIGANGRLGKSITSLSKTAIVPILRHTDRHRLDCDVLIDVSTAEALADNLSAGKPIVVGTTGHADMSLMIAAASKIPLFYTPNFSIGIALVRKMAREASRFFQDAHIIETHHVEKKDKPSGTALLLAKDTGADIHSIRSGKIIGEHTLIFNSEEERIVITHTAHTREIFAKGALAAAHFLVDKPPGLYSMEDLLCDKYQLKISSSAINNH